MKASAYVQRCSLARVRRDGTRTLSQTQEDILAVSLAGLCEFSVLTGDRSPQSSHDPHPFDLSVLNGQSGCVSISLVVLARRVSATHVCRCIALVMGFRAMSDSSDSDMADTAMAPYSHAPSKGRPNWYSLLEDSGCVPGRGKICVIEEWFY